MQNSVSIMQKQEKLSDKGDLFLKFGVGGGKVRINTQLFRYCSIKRDIDTWRGSTFICCQTYLNNTI